MLTNLRGVFRAAKLSDFSKSVVILSYGLFYAADQRSENEDN